VVLFRKKQQWFRASFKAMLFAFIIFKIALGFRKKAEKMNRKKS
jgi:hypothetical protein